MIQVYNLNFALRLLCGVVYCTVQLQTACSQNVAHVPCILYAANVIHFVTYTVMFSDWFPVQLQAGVLLQAQSLFTVDSSNFKVLFANY